MPPLAAQARASRRALLVLLACAAVAGCTGTPTTSESPLPTASPATDDGTDATDSALTGAVMPGITF